MIELRKKLKVRPGAYAIKVGGRLRLPFESRQKTDLNVELESGEAVALALPRGEILRGGDLVVASDGRVIEVVSAPEKLLHVTCDAPTALVRAAYHLGDRHVPVEVGDGYLRIEADDVLETLLRGLGADVKGIEAPFEPDAGAYAGGHHHHEEAGHGGRTHERGTPAHDHDHSHDHDRDRDHAQGHSHDHDACGHDHDHDHAKGQTHSHRGHRHD